MHPRVASERHRDRVGIGKGGVLLDASATLVDDSMVTTARYTVQTTGQGDVRDITSEVEEAVAASQLQDGVATIAVVGSTAAVTTIEFEPGAVSDLGRLLEQLAPRAGEYAHHERWGDDNGSSHVRAALLGPSVTIPFSGAKLVLGTWQQLVLVECDTRSRSREIVVQMLGE
jgi:secondary thiamine-phosphate synthase enzyme